MIIAVLSIVAANNALFYVCVHVFQKQSFTLIEWLSQPKSMIVSLGTVVIITVISALQWKLLREGGDALAKQMGATVMLLHTAERNERRLLNIVEEMAIASGVSMPSVYIMKNEPGINAFVAGLDQTDAVLVVTQGAVEQLTRQELQGVIGHEFSHIFNADLRINLQLISLLSGILFLSDAGRFILSHFRDSDYRSGHHGQESANPFVFLLPMAFILFIVGSVGLFFARLIKSSISRQREYLADASAVQYTRDNMGLASALYKINSFKEGSYLNSAYAEEASHMCFSEPVYLFSKHLGGLLSTHPSIDQRIQAICPNWSYATMQAAIRHQSVSQSQTQGTASYVPDGVLSAVKHTSMKHPMAATIGQPDVSHTIEAKQLIHAIPDSLRMNLHIDSKVQAQAIVLGLLITDNTQLSQSCFAVIQDQFGTDFRKKVAGLVELISDQPRKFRLVIFELLLPALKTMNRAERKRLFNVLREIIQLDRQVSQFEFSLYWLLKKQLYGIRQHKQPSIHSLKSVDNEVAILVATMIAVSGKSEDYRRKVFKTIMSGLGFSNMLMPVAAFESAVIHTAITELAKLSPIPKQSLLYALEDCITEDGQIDCEEAELYRAIAALLDCPVPPILTAA